MTLVVLAVLLLVYTYAGYPILVAALAKWRALPPPRVAPGFEPTVTALVPVFDGEGYIGQKLESLLAQDYPADKLDVVVFSDGSTDGTEAIVEAWALKFPGRVRLLRSEARVGKPTALNRMRAIARGEVLLMTDARQPISPNAVRALVEPLASREIGAVSGNLVLEGAAGSGAYWRYEKWIRQNEARHRSMVGVSGALYAIRRVDLPELPEDLILDDVWIPMRLRLEGKRIVFAEAAKAFDRAFEDDREFSRKVRTLAGNFQLFALLPGLLSPSHNPSWLETVSHKALRLVCPWLLLALFFASTRLAIAPTGEVDVVGLVVARMLLAGQAAFYGLALVGPGARKLGTVARTFVVMNVAAMMGAWRWATSGQRVTW